MAKFKVGDVVKHKGSDERGVVIEVIESCQAADHVAAMERNSMFLCTALALKTPHDYKPSGYYSVSYGFGRKITVAECEICDF